MNKSPDSVLNLEDIFEMLGTKRQSGGLHVDFNEVPLTEHPFPYPFRLGSSGILILLGGRMKIQINLEVFTAEANQVLFLPADAIAQLLEVDRDTKPIGIVFTEEFAIKHVHHPNDLNVLRFFALKNTPVWPLPQGKGVILFRLIERLYQLNISEGEPYHEELKSIYFNAFLLELMAEYRKTAKELEPKTARKKEVILQFLHLLTIHAKKERNVGFYAEKLHITPDYLSKILKEASGTATAKDIIEEIVVHEARNMLSSTSMSVAQIAEELNFSDQSFFGKFFRKKMKISPKAFRNQC